MDLDEGKGKRKCQSFPTYHVELLLQFFIGIVDTELFKAVDFECFKSKICIYSKLLVYWKKKIKLPQNFKLPPSS